MSGITIADIEVLFNAELITLNEWFQANLLSLNVKKTSCIIFSNRENLKINIMLASTVIDVIQDTKFLGIIISQNLKWNKHIDIVLNKSSKNIGIIAKVRHLLPIALTRALYSTLVEPYITYCNIIWSQPEPTVKLDKVFKIQKKYCRLITFSGFITHSKPLFKQLSILNVYQIYKHQLGIFMYKNLNFLIPPITDSFTSNFILNSNVHQHFTRQHHQLHQVYCRTKLRKMTVVIQGLTFWNKLPSVLRESPSLGVFRKKLKLHLLQHD